VGYKDTAGTKEEHVSIPGRGRHGFDHEKIAVMQKRPHAPAGESHAQGEPPREEFGPEP